MAKMAVRVACLALAVPLAMNADARGSARAGASLAGSQATPVVDGGYLYSQLYMMATSFSYGISGADGPPQDPSSPFNLPPTVNGWQELSRTGGTRSPARPRTGRSPASRPSPTITSAARAATGSTPTTPRFPWVAGTGAGHLYAIWFDRRLDPANVNINTWDARSANGRASSASPP